ncbi:MAG TPA: hypothetical protein VFV98_15490 [Vicinamibacterales bacterium]|nr:hypothetical protein [Vicinamibacterales bacterium]
MTVSALTITAAVTTATMAAVPGDAQFGGPSTRNFTPPIVFQAAGPNAASLQAVMDQFRLAIGGNNNGNGGSANSGRREINWDGGGSTATSEVSTPFSGFLANRGALFATPGTGFVQATVEGLATVFGNSTYVTEFKAFTLSRLFSPVNSNITETTFFIPGSGANPTPALTSAFGAVFSDVDQPDGSGPGNKRGNRGASTLIQYFGSKGELLFSSFVPASPGQGTFTFFGIVFADARIASVRILAGDEAGGPNDEPGRDIVMMDDFIYGEPRIGG